MRSFSSRSVSFFPSYSSFCNVYRFCLLHQPQSEPLPVLELLVPPGSQHRQWPHDLWLCAGVLCQSTLPCRGGYTAYIHYTHSSSTSSHSFWGLSVDWWFCSLACQPLHHGRRVWFHSHTLFVQDLTFTIHRLHQSDCRMCIQCKL